MKITIYLGFLIVSITCELTRHSDDVLKRNKIFIEAHRGVTEGQKNHNTKEAILDAIEKGVESFETDAWLTADKQVVLMHDALVSSKHCPYFPDSIHIHNINWSELANCKDIITIPLLDDIMEITKGKIFMNLEIKDDQDEIWEKIQELIEKHEYYEQISVCSFNHKFFQYVEQYNKDFDRKIVFGFLNWDILELGPLDIKREDIFNLNKPNHQITLNVRFIKNYPGFVKQAHDKGMVVGVYFFNILNIIKEPEQYYDLFDIGVDVIITDYPLRVKEQLIEYYSDKAHLEGCKTIEKNDKNITTCTSCESGYVLVRRREEERNLCKLKYEIDQDLYTIDTSGVYHEKNIFAIKMLFSPIGNHTICQKNGRTIFYFEWKFDLYGYEGSYKRRFILNENKIKYSSGFAKLTEKHIKKLNFSLIEIYVDNKLIDPNDFLCIDLDDIDYYTTYQVMLAHCYLIYNGGEQKSSYSVKFRLFDDNFLSFVTYDNIFLSDEDSW